MLKSKIHSSFWRASICLLVFIACNNRKDCSGKDVYVDYCQACHGANSNVSLSVFTLRDMRSMKQDVLYTKIVSVRSDTVHVKFINFLSKQEVECLVEFLSKVE